MNKFFRFYMKVMDYFMPAHLKLDKVQDNPENLFHTRLVVSSLLATSLFVFPNLVYGYLVESPTFLVELVLVAFPLLALLLSIRAVSNISELFRFMTLLFSMAISWSIYLNSGVNFVTPIWALVIIGYGTIIVSIKWGFFLACYFSISTVLLTSLFKIDKPLITAEHGLAILIEFMFALLLTIGLFVADNFINDEYRRTLEKLNDTLLNRKLSNLSGSKLSTVSKMAAGVSHQFNNPLAIVAGIANRIETLSHRDALTQEALGELTEKIDSTLVRIENLTSALKTLGHIIPHERVYTRFDIYNLIRHCLEDSKLIERFPSVEFRSPPNSSRLPYVAGDFHLLRHSIFYLLENAFEEAAREPGGFVGVEFSWLDESVEVLIKNSGVKVVEENLDLLLEPFYSTKSTKNNVRIGLGLTIAENILRIHNSNLYLAKEAEHTTFCFKLSTRDFSLTRTPA